MLLTLSLLLLGLVPPPKVTTADAITLVLGAGGVGFIVAVSQVVQAWRQSAETREGKAIANLEKWRQDADLRAERCLFDLDYERRVSAYWAYATAMRERQLLVAGETPNPLPPFPQKPTPPAKLQMPPDSEN